MARFIPLFEFSSINIKNVEHTVFINTNTIVAYSYFIQNNKECLLVKLDHNKMQGTAFPREYTVCKEDNPIAFSELFKSNHTKLPKE